MNNVMNTAASVPFDWQSPPWQGGAAKYRLGLRPIESASWFQSISDELLRYKKNLLTQRYDDVVQVVEDSRDAQKMLGEHFEKTHQLDFNFPDMIADLSLQVADDLCLIEAQGEQRLLAASVCSPTYWNIREKIGQPLARIHEPVTSLESKIGEKIARSISSAPLLTPFERTNWFVHCDEDRFHLESEAVLQGEPRDWFVRSERETICRFHEDYALFTINVRFARLRTIHQFPEAKADLLRSLATFDHDEVEYFGGPDKVEKIQKFLTI